MNNKLLLAIIAVQTAAMLGLLYILWDQKTIELIFNDNTLLVLAVFSVMCLVLALGLQAKKPITYEEGVRRDGTVKWFNPSKGFGFIEQDTGDDLFVHQSEIQQAGFRYLNLGDRVEFEVGPGKKGPVALKVIRTKPTDPEKYPSIYDEPEEAPLTQVSETPLN